MVLEHEFSVIHRLRIKGRAEAQQIAAVVGADVSATQAALEALAARGITVHRKGRVSGWLLTPDGRLECSDSMERHRKGIDTQTLTKLYDDRFLPANQKFKVLCSRFQETQGDHGTTLTQLEAVHSDIGPMIEEFGVELDWFPHAYSPRLESAFKRFREGERSALLQPFTDSYHDVWMELHEDLLLVLGRRRENED